MVLGEKLRALGEFAVTVRFPVFTPPLAVAATVTVVLVETFTVETMKVAEFAPAGILTDAGIDPTAELPAVTVRVTVVSFGTGALIVTVPVLLAPATTELGENATELGVFAVTVKVPFTVVPLAVAEILGVVEVETVFVPTVKFAVELPAGTVTEEGRDEIADPPLTIASATTVSCAAGAAIVTVPVVERPPTNELGLNFKVLGTSGVMVSVAVSVAPLNTAVSVAVDLVATPLVVTFAAALVEPTGTVNVGAITASELLLERLMVVLASARPTR